MLSWILQCISIWQTLPHSSHLTALYNNEVELYGILSHCKMQQPQRLNSTQGPSLLDSLPLLKQTRYKSSKIKMEKTQESNDSACIVHWYVYNTCTQQVSSYILSRCKCSWCKQNSPYLTHDMEFLHLYTCTLNVFAC